MTFPKRDEALRHLGEYRIVHEHDDGDLTVESDGDLYVVTTEGKLFREYTGEVESEMAAWLLVHSLPYAHGSPGVVTNPELAARTPCTCYDNICFSRGIRGALSESQKEAYCPTIEHKESPGIKRRLEHWRESVSICKAEIENLPKGEKGEPYRECMGRELAKHGIEI